MANTQSLKKVLFLLIYLLCLSVGPLYLMKSNQQISLQRINSSLKLVQEHKARLSSKIVKTLTEMAEKNATQEEVYVFLRRQDVSIKRSNAGIIVRYSGERLSQFSRSVTLRKIILDAVSFFQDDLEPHSQSTLRKKYCNDLSNTECLEKMSENFAEDVDLSKPKKIYILQKLWLFIQIAAFIPAVIIMPYFFYRRLL